jgi:hypothetical protein
MCGMPVEGWCWWEPYCRAIICKRTACIPVRGTRVRAREGVHPSACAPCARAISRVQAAKVRGRRGWCGKRQRIGARAAPYHPHPATAA